MLESPQENNPYRAPDECGARGEFEQAQQRTSRHRRMPPSSLWAFLFLFGPAILGVLAIMILEFLC